MAATGAALVTGASYGVGAATALALARAGYDVAVTATKVENLAPTVKALEACGRSVLAAALDLRSEADVARVTKEVFGALGGIDVLVNNAGTNLRRLAIDVTASEWDALMAVNIRGTFFLTQAVGAAREISRNFSLLKLASLTPTKFGNFSMSRAIKSPVISTPAK
jgi:NAD(P)-dependent dehydrogenase (short-subunit alcohol dehydrogenase family)